jgi:hypothetical protein
VTAPQSRCLRYRLSQVDSPFHLFRGAQQEERSGRMPAKLVQMP